MICQFQFRAPAAGECAVSPLAAALPTKVCPVTAPVAGIAAAQAVNPLRKVLADLKGRQVTILAGGKEICGRVLTVDPLMLVAYDGTATLVDWSAVKSVQF